MIPFSHEEGKELVRIARDAVERLFHEVEPIVQLRKDEVEAGVFVSLHRCSARGYSLRGCIGFPFPKDEFYSSLAEAAVAAAVGDPRFEPISEKELDTIVFEVSILSRPQLIAVEKPVDYLNNVTIGEDGLMLNSGEYSSLLLPQVAVEFDWAVEEYLSNLCYKAGLTADTWMEDGVKIYKFGCTVYREREPRGEICHMGISCI